VRPASTPLSNLALCHRTNILTSVSCSHLYYIFFELLKNSMRATCETHIDAAQDHDEDSLPPVKVVVVDSASNEDIAIRISDHGGGMKRSDLPKVWSYFYTTAWFDIHSTDLTADWEVHETPLAGLGFGLPLSRQYARYFGGDLQVVSLEGHGTDAYLHLGRTGTTVEQYGLRFIEI
jgi:pyruvate dehydrogenase kinase 2/3/4